MSGHPINRQICWEFAVVIGNKNQARETEEIILYIRELEDEEIIEIAKYCWYLGNPKILHKYDKECSFLELDDLEKYAYAEWRLYREVVSEAKGLDSIPDPAEYKVLAEIPTDI